MGPAASTQRVARCNFGRAAVLGCLAVSGPEEPKWSWVTQQKLANRVIIDRYKAYNVKNPTQNV